MIKNRVLVFCIFLCVFVLSSCQNSKSTNSERKYITEFGDKIYYLEDTPNNVIGDYELWRENKDGTREKLFIDVDSYYILDDNKILLSTDIPGGLELSSLNDLTSSKLYNDPVHDYMVIDDKVYYINEHEIGVISIITKSKEVIYEFNYLSLTMPSIKCSNLYIYKNMVYFIDKYGEFYSVDKKGIHKIAKMKEPFSIFFILNGKVYYSSLGEKSVLYYEMPIDGSGLKEISRDDFTKRKEECKNDLLSNHSFSSGLYR